MASSKLGDEAYSVNADGSAKSPEAFLQALRADAEKMKLLETEPEALKVVQSGDLQKFQELLKTVYSVCLPRCIKLVSAVSCCYVRC